MRTKIYWAQEKSPIQVSCPLSQNLCVSSNPSPFSTMESLLSSSSSPSSIGPQIAAAAKYTPAIPRRIALYLAADKSKRGPPVFSSASPRMSQAQSPEKEAKLWGGRFEESVTDVVERFTESISFDKGLYKHDIMGSLAHAHMLAQKGLISASDENNIVYGLKEIERQIEAGEFVWRTDREDVHMNIEAALTDLIGEPAKKLHTARSRNDQVLTDFRLWCRDAIDAILLRIKQLQVVNLCFAVCSVF